MLQAAQFPGRDRKLTVRPLRLEIAPDTPRYWMGANAWETHLLNALSLTFPPGERFFMRSVRALRERAKDPDLLEQIKGFLAQESLHSREHSVLNTWLGKLGLPAEVIDKRVEARIAERSGKRSELDNLAVTCALEHFTAMLAKLLLTDPTLRARFHPNMLPLWYWHAIEELDHKAVAFDVYLAADGDYRRRVLAMVAMTIGLITSTMVIQYHLMRADKQPIRLGTWLRGALRYLGPKGHVTAVIPDYLRYYRRDFHPWQEDDRALIAEAERELRLMLEGYDA
ncbi:MAG: metal-dependent hydrolase [Myxococcales bacterium]